MQVKIKIAITDNEGLIVQLLSDYFNQQENIDVCFTASSGEDFVEKIKEMTIPPDVALLDLRMDEMDGVEASKFAKEKFPDIKIIIMSSHYKKTFTGYMFRNGIDSFIPKELSPQELKKIVETVHTTGHYFSQEDMEVMRSQISGNAPKPSFEVDKITDREKEVLKHICKQATAQEIADILCTSKRTVEGHKSSLILKTGAKNSAGLVIYAIQNQLFDPNDIIFNKVGN